MIKNYYLVLTKACNLRCVYCHQGQDKPDFSKGSLVEPDKVASYFPKDGNYRVTLFGGEPLLDFDYFCRIADAIRSNNPEVQLNTITNGTFLSVDRAKKLNELGVAVGLSHDGKHHAITRGTKDILLTNPDAYLTITNRSIAATACRMNYDFYDVWDYLEDFKIKQGLNQREHCYIQVVKDVEDNTDEKLLILDMPEWESMLDRVFCNLEKQLMTGDFSSYEFMQYNSWFLSMNHRLQNPMGICTSCGADKHTCHIDINGNLYPCHNMRQSNGHVAVGGLMTGSYNPYRDREKCQNCEAFIICGGGCIATPEHKHKYSCYIHYQQITRMLKLLKRLQIAGIGGKE